MKSVSHVSERLNLKFQARIYRNALHGMPSYLLGFIRLAYRTARQPYGTEASGSGPQVLVRGSVGAAGHDPKTYLHSAQRLR